MRVSICKLGDYCNFAVRFFISGFMAAKKQILDLAWVEDDFFEGGALTGIASPLPPSRLCWTLNRAFDLQFVREPEQDLCMSTPARSEPSLNYYFPVFQYQSIPEATCYTLYRLKTGQESLLPELLQMDYMWMLRSNTPEEDAELFVRGLRQLAEVQMAQVIEAHQLTNGANLVM